ncbi:MAG: replication initiator protein A [Lachnospiraceae bacterium]|nr:replication initiator protein A [Lachnospiraceae bacterium]
MTFDYYTGAQAEQFSFIRIPKLLLLHETFSPLSIQAKLLYAVLLDRMSLSLKNHWVDTKNRAYIIYPVEEIVQDLGFTRKKAMDVLAELETFGLVTKKRRGRGLPNYLYVMDFLSGIAQQAGLKSRNRRDTLGTSEPGPSVWDMRGTGSSTSVGTPLHVRSSETGTSERQEEVLGVQEPASQEVPKPTLPEVPELSPLEVPESVLQEVPKSTLLKNKTYLNQTDRNQTGKANILSYPTISSPDNGMGSDGKRPSSVVLLRKQVRERIGYEDLLISHSGDREIIDGIVELILEMELSGKPEMVIAGDSFPTELIQERFQRLRRDHVEYVLECMNVSSVRVRNMKKYLLAALLNATSTIGSYYGMLVRSDMTGASSD